MLRRKQKSFFSIQGGETTNNGGREFRFGLKSLEPPVDLGLPARKI